MQALRYIFQFAVYLLLQELVFNYLALWDLAVPHVFLVFLMVLPFGTNRMVLYTTAFVMGLLLSIFTPPVGAQAVAALAVMGLRELLVRAITPQVALGGREELLLERQNYTWLASYCIPFVVGYELIYHPVADLGFGWLTLAKILLSSLYSSLVCIVFLVFFYKKT